MGVVGEGRGREECLVFNLFTSVLFGFFHKHVFYKTLHKKHIKIFVPETNLRVSGALKLYKETCCQSAKSTSGKH